jgi:polysaccharide export outer membrane protein
MIDVFGVPDLSQKEIQADTSGNISFPLVGTVPAGGKTPAEVAALIADGLRGKYIRDPQVTVNLKETVSQVVTVSGDVKEPGLYPVVGHMTLMRAIATAKGVGDTADTGNVVVFRTVNGQKMAALYNLTAIQRGNYDDPEIYPNDVVVLGDSQARRLFRDFLQLAPALSYAVVTLVR